VQVTDASGSVLLSTDPAVCCQLLVAGGTVAGEAGPCPHVHGIFNPANGVTPVQLAPFSTTPNPGAIDKAWPIPFGSATVSAIDPRVLNFNPSTARTDSREAPHAIS
jgi:hypothetical protein